MRSMEKFTRDVKHMSGCGREGFSGQRCFFVRQTAGHFGRSRDLGTRIHRPKEIYGNLWQCFCLFFKGFDFKLKLGSSDPEHMFAPRFVPLEVIPWPR